MKIREYLGHDAPQLTPNQLMLLVLQNLNHIPIAIGNTSQGIRIAARNDEALVNGELCGSHLTLIDLFCLLQQPRSLYVIVDDSLLELPVH